MNYFLLIAILIFVGPFIGSLIGVIKKPTTKVLSASLSFAGGIMVFVPIIELLPESIKLTSWITATTGTIIGAALILIIDKFLPHINPVFAKKEKPNIKRTATMLIIGMAIHNLPEGLAVSSGYTIIPELGLLIVLSIALHDIPEAIATILPIFAASRKRFKSILVSSAVSLFELAGFLAGYFIFKNIAPLALGIIIALTAGIMIYLSFEELFPAANIRKNPFVSVLAIIFSFVFVLVTKLLFL